MSRSIFASPILGTVLALPSPTPWPTATPSPTPPPPSQAVDLGSLTPGARVYATAVNARGQVVGASDDGAFLWQNGVMTSLSTMTGQQLGTPPDINGRGQIVTSYYSSTDERYQGSEPQWNRIRR